MSRGRRVSIAAPPVPGSTQQTDLEEALARCTQLEQLVAMLRRENAELREQLASSGEVASWPPPFFASNAVDVAAVQQARAAVKVQAAERGRRERVQIDKQLRAARQSQAFAALAKFADRLDDDASFMD